MDQLRARKALLEEQKVLKREMFNQAKKEYEDYLKEEKRQLENQVKYKSQFRKDLNDQIKASKEIHVSVQYYIVYYYYLHNTYYNLLLAMYHVAMHNTLIPI